jgi:hypothetical protein
MRQVEASLMQTIMLGAISAGLVDFEDKPRCFFYRGKSGAVEFDKRDGSLKVFQKGQQAPFYDSLHLDECVDLEHSWMLSYELGQDLRKAIAQSRRNGFPMMAS